ncbi:MAG: hypothetical protein Fur006_26450 [Coleofasciculaceae cyanobacterium]
MVLRQLPRVASSLGLRGAITLTALIGCFLSDFFWNSALTQITPDATWGTESSAVTRLDALGLPVDRIDGGATRGTNLFHSFLEFNVEANRGAYFFSPANIQNILVRVTGSNRSEILGTLGTFGNSNANLFLINPYGIIFGQNARLDVRGSFVATTANAIQFGNQGFFSATQPEAPPLLTVNPSAFFFNQITPGRIENRSIARVGLLAGIPLLGLRVPDGRSLLLVGGDVSLIGGGLHAVGGRVEVAGVAGSGMVGLNVDGNKLNLSFPESLARADLSFTDAAIVNASGRSGGNIQVWGRRVTLSKGSQIVTNTLGSGVGGSLSVNASESVQVIGRSANGRLGSGLFAQTVGTGAGGDLTITTGQLLVKDGALISAGTFGEGVGGNLTVTATESVQVIGLSADGRFGSGLFTQADGTGDAGDLTINTQQLIVRDGARVSAAALGGGSGGSLTVNASELVQVIGESVNGRLSSLSAQTQGTGDAGDLTINTRQLLVQDGARVGVSTFGRGAGGNLTVNASESVQVIGLSTDSQFGSGLFAQSAGIQAGEAGNLTINTRQLLVRDGAGGVSVSTFGQGAGGSLTVNASESVQLIGSPSSGAFDSGLFAQTRGTGNAGDLLINTRQLLVQGGARVSSSTFSQGDGGSLRVNASESVQLIGTSADGQFKTGLFANTALGSTGNGGSIFLDSRTVIIRDGASIAVDSQGTGEGGNIEIRASALTLDKGASIFAETASNTGGDITLQVQDLLLMRNNSLISTTAGTAQAGGDGGNITIDADFIVAVPKEDSDITANAFEGRGGNINITTQGIYGIKFRPRLTPLSDITASSDFGVDGVVEINTPDIDPSQGLANLPSEPVNTEVAQDCQVVGGKTTSSFISTGSGGLPINPYEPLDSREILAEIQPPAQWTSQSVGAATPSTSSKTTRDPIIEAQGWLINEKGEVVLVAEVPPAPSASGCRLR